jgi:hypothetical protein
VNEWLNSPLSQRADPRLEALLCFFELVYDTKFGPLLTSVEDKRLLTDNGTSKADVMTVQNNGLSSDTEIRFRELYATTVNGIQQPRLTQGNNIYESSMNEGDDNEGWKKVQRKTKKVSFTSTREQVGKIGSHVKLGRSNLI